MLVYVTSKCEKGRHQGKKKKKSSFCHGNKLMSSSLIFFQVQTQHYCFQSNAASILWYVAYILRFIWYKKFRTCVISPPDPQRHEYQSTFSWFCFITSIQFSFYLSFATRPLTDATYVCWFCTWTLHSHKKQTLISVETMASDEHSLLLFSPSTPPSSQMNTVASYEMLLTQRPSLP